MRIFILVLVFWAIIADLPVLQITWASLLVVAILGFGLERMLVRFIQSKSARILIALIIAFSVMQTWDTWRLLFCGSMAQNFPNISDQTIRYCESDFFWNIVNFKYGATQ